ncbi:MAG: DUF721 domain-containing protein [Rhodospirillales bacterium]|nr:DUF721 domain-containing protein [Rhodospirillales bacterium]
MAREMGDREDQSKRGGGFRAIGAALPRLATPVLGKRGLGEAQLLLHWEAIVGAELAEDARPERLSFPKGERSRGTLRLRVTPAAAPTVQHDAPLIIERINAFLGYPAVARLSLVQAPPASPRARPAAPRPLRPEERKALAERVAPVGNEELRAALERLGAAVLRAEDA